jgi:predicted transcriptional regulator YdeE
MIKHQIRQLDAFKLVGISVKTTNENNQAKTDIQNLWTRFFDEKIISKIANRVNDEVFALYTDYEGDFMKPYLAMIGCKVSLVQSIPVGLTCKEVPATKFAVVEVQGEYPASLIETWQTIWRSNIDRAYTFDFEHYPVPFDAKTNTNFSIYVALK